jgi:predicted oxidoreductase
MRTYALAGTLLNPSRIGYGCMNLGGSWDRNPPTETDVATALEAVTSAVEHGITLFDHADIYAHGKSEIVFARVLRQLPELRECIVLQSKCGIRFADDPRPGDPLRYDFSYEHILCSVDGILQRLETDHLDILLLHRPDPLVEPDEVARAFDTLQQQGKVRHFGVSNHSAAQIELLERSIEQPLIINQLELNPLHAHLIDGGVMVNRFDAHHAAAAEVLEYCRLHGIRMQAWSPLAGGRLSQPGEAAAETVAALAADYQTSPEAILLAWLLRHPAGIQPIIGTLNPQRIAACCAADRIELDREDWYRLYVAARGAALP